jgi:Phage gp6-like head-tail connector protein
MATLITLEQAKEELRITHTEEDALITRKLEESEAAVFRLLNFYGEPPSPFAPETPWDATTVPADVRAILMQAFVDLYRWRGDDEEPPKDPNQGGDGWPTARLMGMLRRWMEPVSA